MSRCPINTSCGPRADHYAMPKKPTKSGAVAELAELAPIEDDPSRADAKEAILRALGSKHAHVVSRAAALIRRERLEGFEDPLLVAYARFFENAIKTDPGCHAKVAILEALDHLDHGDPDPFLRAVEYTQIEPRWNTGEDTATGLRTRGAFGLARLAHGDALLSFAQLLADPAAVVRQGAALAIAHLGRRDGASLLLLRLYAGESDPSALAEVVRALVALAPDHARRATRPLLEDESLRELVAHALATAESDAGIAIVLEELDASVLSHDRALLLGSLGASRREKARAFLLQLIAEGTASDAVAAVRGLAIHRYDARLADAIGDAISRNSSPELRDAFEDSFGER
jgi:hypothetical protein